MPFSPTGNSARMPSSEIAPLFFASCVALEAVIEYGRLSFVYPLRCGLVMTSLPLSPPLFTSTFMGVFGVARNVYHEKTAATIIAATGSAVFRTRTRTEWRCAAWKSASAFSDAPKRMPPLPRPWAVTFCGAWLDVVSAVMSRSIPQWLFVEFRKWRAYLALFHFNKVYLG